MVRFRRRSCAPKGILKAATMSPRLPRREGHARQIRRRQAQPGTTARSRKRRSPRWFFLIDRLLERERGARSRRGVSEPPHSPPSRCGRSRGRAGRECDAEPALDRAKVMYSVRGLTDSAATHRRSTRSGGSSRRSSSPACADRPRRRPGRGAGAGRAGRRARAVAGVGRPGQPGRLADGDREAPRDRPCCAATSCSSASTRSSATSSTDGAATAAPDLDAALDDDIGDDLLRLIFTACHPVLSTEARVALTLRLLGGLTTEEIARAFLVPGADDRAAHRARQADARRERGAVRGAARRRAGRRACRRCSRSST